MEVLILGNNSAVPAHDRHPSSQLIRIHQHHFLVDCGEGTQLQLSRYHVKRNKISSIFISHLHGDHVYGLPGLITSFNHLGRTRPLTIYAPDGLQEITELQMEYGKVDLHYDIQWKELKSGSNVLISTTDLEVSCFPLYHRVPTWGFKFIEKFPLVNIIPEKIEQYQLSYEQIRSVKEGQDLYHENYGMIPNSELTLEPKPDKSYAYCSDTCYHKKVIARVKEVDLLYHEATFAEDHIEKAHLTKHATAKEAALIAKQADVGTLLLGHYSSRYEDPVILEQEARTVFPKSYASEEGKVYRV